MNLPLLKTVFRSFGHKIWLGLLLFAITLSLLTFGLTRHLAASVSVPPLLEKTSQNSSTTSGSSTKPVKRHKHSVSVAPKIVLPKDCSPDNNYKLPSKINLLNQPIGLTQITDPTSYYRVYGDTSSQIQAQVQRCAPKTGGSQGNSAEFTAETSYSLNTLYSWEENEDGKCHVTEVKVGLHINMVLPQWHATSVASTGLASAWQAYMPNLLTHENGHVSIDRKYAGRLLNDLKAYPATNCETIAAKIQAKVSADIAALNTANSAYDSVTNHGASQGAILP